MASFVAKICGLTNIGNSLMDQFQNFEPVDATVDAVMVLHLLSKNISVGHQIFPTAPLL